MSISFVKPIRIMPQKTSITMSMSTSHVHFHFPSRSFRHYPGSHSRICQPFTHITHTSSAPERVKADLVLCGFSSLLPIGSVINNAVSPKREVTVVPSVNHENIPLDQGKKGNKKNIQQKYSPWCGNSSSPPIQTGIGRRQKHPRRAE